jgi:hypothetical protein
MFDRRKHPNNDRRTCALPRRKRRRWAARSKSSRSVSRRSRQSARYGSVRFALFSIIHHGYEWGRNKHCREIERARGVGERGATTARQVAPVIQEANTCAQSSSASFYAAVSSLNFSRCFFKRAFRLTAYVSLHTHTVATCPLRIDLGWQNRGDLTKDIQACIHHILSRAKTGDKANWQLSSH